MPDVRELLERAAPEPAAAWNADDIARRGRTLRRRRQTGWAGGAAAALAAAVVAVVVIQPLSDPTRDVTVAPTDTPAGAIAEEGWPGLIERVPAEPAGSLPPVLVFADLPAAGEAAGIELPGPGESAWADAFRGGLGGHVLPPARLGLARVATRLDTEHDIGRRVGLVPTDIDQVVEWHPDGPWVATLRTGTDDLDAFLDDSPYWALRGDDAPRVYQARTPEGAVGDYAEPDDPDSAIVVHDGFVEIGASTDGASPEASPQALSPRTTLADLPGMDTLADALQGRAHAALVVPSTQQQEVFSEVEAVGEQLAPYRHLAVASIGSGDGARAVLLLVHEDADTAAANAARLKRNAAEAGLDGTVTQRGRVLELDPLRTEPDTVVRMQTTVDLDPVGVAHPERAW